jgi:hypothetical protein
METLAQPVANRRSRWLRMLATDAGQTLRCRVAAEADSRVCPDVRAESHSAVARRSMDAGVPASSGLADEVAAQLDLARWADFDADACERAGAFAAANGLRRKAAGYRDAAMGAGGAR